MNVKYDCDRYYWVCAAEHASGSGAKLYIHQVPVRAKIQTKLDPYLYNRIVSITKENGSKAPTSSLYAYYIFDTYESCVELYNEKIRAALQHIDDIIKDYTALHEKYKKYIIQ